MHIFRFYFSFIHVCHLAAVCQTRLINEYNDDDDDDDMNCVLLGPTGDIEGIEDVILYKMVEMQYIFLHFVKRLTKLRDLKTFTTAAAISVLVITFCELCIHCWMSVMLPQILSVLRPCNNAAISRLPGRFRKPISVSFLGLHCVAL